MPGGRWSPGTLQPRPVIEPVFFGGKMVSIQFQKPGIYHEATENGGHREVKIPAGTVMRDLSAARADRWVRRGVAVVIPDDLTPAIPPAPPAPPAPVEPVAETVPPLSLRERFAPPPPPPAGEGNGST